MSPEPAHADLPMVRATGLHKHFGALHVLRGVSLTVARGEVVAILGPSGSGKSTLLRCLNHLETVQRGSIEIAGQKLASADATGASSYPSDSEVRRICQHTGMVFQHFNLFPHLTVLGNLIEAPITVRKQSRADVVPRAEALLAKSGCVLKNTLVGVLGDALWGKLHQIGYFDVSTVSNNSGDTEFVSLPGALSKYVPDSLADMLDDAKALASSLAYGIAVSHQARGRIRDPSVLLSRLISRGYVEGNAPAIAADYQVSEERGVVRVTTTDRGYRLTLLKKEVGEMARALILDGDASQVAAGLMASGAARAYRGPESARVAARRPFVGASNRVVRSTLDILRKS